MPDKNESLISQKIAEREITPFLFSQTTMDALTAAERSGEYTLERVREVKPEVIDEVIRLRGQYIGQLRIAKLLGLHHRTIAAIDRTYPERIDAERRTRVARLRSAADKLVELVDDNPETVPANVRCLAASQLYDKAQLLDGGATANLAIDMAPRVDWNASFKKFEDVVKEIDALWKAGAIDIPKLNELSWDALHALQDETGFRGKNDPSKRNIEEPR